MNIPSEQITKDSTVKIDADQVLSFQEMTKALTSLLGSERCSITIFPPRRHVLKYKREDGVIELLLLVSISFMGGKHPVYRHRSQLKTWYKEFYSCFKDNENYNIRILGVYHYEGNIILVDFEKDTYLKRKMHNSAAWVYTNDLYQAMQLGTFTREDKNGNVIHSIRSDCLCDYLNARTRSKQEHLFSFFSRFNCESNLFNGWISICDAIDTMYKSSFRYWKETEWLGWYLEFVFEQFIKDNSFENIVVYANSKSNKEIPSNYVFDIWFPQDHFFGDLKGSDISKSIAPGNDQTSLIQNLNEFGKFWYVIYEAYCEKTPKARQIRFDYLEKVGEIKEIKDNPDKKHRLLKERVKFHKMMIIEINKVNYREVLSDFTQGRQPNGDKRNTKFNINKNNIDNFIVYSQTLFEIQKRKAQYYKNDYKLVADQEARVTNLNDTSC